MRKRSKFLISLSFAAIAYCGWLLFTAEFTSHEMLLGAGCTLLTAFLTASAWRQMKVRFIPTFRQLVTAWRIGWYALTGSWEMLVILARTLAAIKKPGSHFVAVKFPLARGSRGAAESILATAYMTATPSSIVIGADGEWLLFHQIEREGISRLLIDLEASR